jgi:hypothetical protein
MAVAAAHDLDCLGASPSNRGFHLAPEVTCIADDTLDEGEGVPCLLKERLGSISVLHAGRVDVDG